MPCEPESLKVAASSSRRRTGALGLREGDEVVLYLDQGEVRIVTPERAIEMAQEIVHQYIPPGRSLVEDLIAERRREAAGE